MIITPRVYAHRRLNQAQKAVMAGNFKLAAVVILWAFEHPSAASALWKNDYRLFLSDHPDFKTWVMHLTCPDLFQRVHNNQQRRRNART